MIREISDEDFQLLQQVRQTQAVQQLQTTELAKPLPWFRGRKFILNMMILFLIFGAIPGFLLMLLMWTGRVARPIRGKNSKMTPMLTRTDKTIWSFLVLGWTVVHVLMVGM